MYFTQTGGYRLGAYSFGPPVWDVLALIPVLYAYSLGAYSLGFGSISARTCALHKLGTDSLGALFGDLLARLPGLYTDWRPTVSAHRVWIH